jgi:hypothetical protein
MNERGTAKRAKMKYSYREVEKNLVDIQLQSFVT